MILDPYTWYTATIVQIIRESRHAVSVLLHLDMPYTFSPGQHAVIRVSPHPGSSVVRQYSFSSTQENGLWLTIVKTPDGVVSSWFVDQAVVGDSIKISQPFTGPLIDATSLDDTPICLIAGGSGIAPIMSILRSRRSKNVFETTLVYSTRTDERCFADELSPQKNEIIHLRDTSQTSRITKNEIEEWCTNSQHIYICGSRQFVDTIRDYIKKTHPSAAVHCEAFSIV